MKPLFPLGRTVGTPGAIQALVEAGHSASEFLDRHQVGDWGEVDECDWQENERALRNQARLLSAYRLSDGTKIWIITEADRSVTTILLPEEY